MKNTTSFWILLIALTTTMASCDVVGGIFKAGFWAAIIMIVLVIALIFWLLKRFRR